MKIIAYNYRTQEEFLYADDNTPPINKLDNEHKLVKTTYNYLGPSKKHECGIAQYTGFIYGRFAAVKENGNYWITDLQTGMGLIQPKHHKIKTKHHLEYVLNNLQGWYDQESLTPYDTFEKNQIHVENLTMFLRELVVDYES